MELVKSLYEYIRPLIPTSVTVLVMLFLILAVRATFEKRLSGKAGYRYRLQLILFLLFLAGVFLIILVLPVSEATRGQLLGLLGILLTAAIALSSTTFLGNAMGGLMLRAVRAFRPGDFLRTGEHFGRVSEQGLLHVEIQTEERDLVTLPNLFLVTNPYKVIRPSGTLISADVSLGYDHPAPQIQKLLLEAASEAALADPFVHILDLGDFAVTYRVSGLLREVRHLLSARSLLHEKVLHALHAGGIEIVSPTFMNTRRLEPGVPIIPVTAPEGLQEGESLRQKPPEDLIFDKAEQAESLERLREKLEATGVALKEAEERRRQATSADAEQEITREIEALKVRRQRLAEVISRRENAEN